MTVLLIILAISCLLAVLMPHIDWAEAHRLQELERTRIPKVGGPL